jgi:outer membrane cobalamin receptor
MTFVGLRSVLVVVLLVALASGCQAQTPTEPSPSQDHNDTAANKTAPNNTAPAKPTLRTVITVTGQPLSVSLAPASVSVMDDEQLNNSHALTSSDVMRTVPFVSLEQNGSAGSLSTLTIRGGSRTWF